MLSQCPKCGHAPLPADQSLPAACPGCGVILAKLAALGVRAPLRVEPVPARERRNADDEGDSLFLHVPERVDPLLFWARVAMLAAFGWWSVVLVRLDVRTGEIGASFLHRPLLVFHEAGHVLFMPFGEWMSVFGGSFFQWLLPMVLAGALLVSRRDPFGAAIGLWLAGVSLMDVAPYIYDALEPQLTLLGGETGENGPHDWIYLLRTMGLRGKAQGIGLAVHRIGFLVMLLSLAWAALVLWLQRSRIDPDAFDGE
jgi:hypothetical protein